ncbi:MAG: bifunctional serine/threonine-protein kinase/formylglycine-generating enzyme family protein [Proteobacteria bacterium]|nr:bifunctional serine/threonine-protein kinase/formylglycine-generating enzyme family protein [Pseudomonadota bacterium]
MLDKTLGQYTITAKIGQGGMAIVYLAQHLKLARKAVVKVLRRHLLSDPEICKRFLNEAKAIASIQHPGVVVVMDRGQLEDGSVYILMEYLDGECLRDRLDRVGALPVARAMLFARQAADALGAAHENNVVHRDLKPANIFLVPDSLVRGGERVKLLDFGIAKLMGDRKPSSIVTRSGVLMGTPIYMSPEQCRGAGSVDERTDLYALGCILFEMLCGRPPFDTKAAGELIVLHLTQQPPAARSINTSVPADLDALIGRLLAKEPGDRYQTARQLVSALDSALAAYARASSRAPIMPEELAGRQPKSSPPTELPDDRADTELADVGALSDTDRDVHLGRGRVDHTVSDDDDDAPPTQEFAPARPANVLARRQTARARSQAVTAGSRPVESHASDVSAAASAELTALWMPVDARRRPTSTRPASQSVQSRPDSGAQAVRPPANQAVDSLQPVAPPPQSILSTGRITQLTHSRIMWFLQIGLLIGFGVGALIYLMIWMVDSFQSTTFAPIASPQRDAATASAGREWRADIASRATKYRPALISIGRGTFWMGSPHRQKWRSKDETPRHQVTLSPFYVCRTEVTQAQWHSVMRTRPSDCRHGCSDSSPVQNVSWFDAVEYFNRLSKREGLSRCYRRNGTRVRWRRTCTGYRFPTEAEWEYAARAGTGSIYSFGDNPATLELHAWYLANSDKRVHPVATRKPNAWGLFDMHGNVQEWVWDQFQRFYPEDAQLDPTGPRHDKPRRVQRGGSFRNEPKDLRSAVRYWNEPGSVNWDTGLRCARSDTRSQ